MSLKRFYTVVIHVLILSFFTAFAVSKYVTFKYSDTEIDIIPTKKNKSVALKTDILKITQSNPMKLRVVDNDEPQKIYSPPKENSLEPLENITLIGLAVNTPKIFALVKLNNKSIILNNKTEEEGYIIKEIFDNKLVVLKGNREIYLDITDLSKQPFAVSNLQEKSSTNENSSSSSLNIKISRTEVEKNLKDINSMIKSVFVSPYYDKNDFVGYRLSRIGTDSIISKIGLKNGDVIVRINDESLENPQKMMELLSKISDVTALKIDIIRRLKKETLFLEIE